MTINTENKRFKTTLEPVTTATANEAQKPHLETSQKQMGMIPNMYANMVNSPGLMETYAVGYEHFRKNSGFSPVEQEVVFVTISIANGCEYCAAAHSFLADNVSKVPVEVTNAIRAEQEIPDAKLNALSVFTRAMFEKRGNPSHEDVEAFLEAGYQEKHILEIILALAVKTLSNYSNHIFHTEVDDMFSGRAWSRN
ncbi:carboxymuconolactone decarboxylase family protein [Pontibacter sp. JH31]|uniref:Carboxymuconolactone decarboxylase family protein n=1 Tax=Pontibacter aquaedesilientis TaxID=2766980 RepID=A0ABR7XEX0_9BACT|nr:carboxymuconolactone decarboxylase family protein [Pontibacter aquaedesilientis]MBD1396840.1 carboxymuconolactone decarboxylase family protein [Pontibacter aquaedesilientis]